MGLRLTWLGTERLTWRDLIVIARQSPRSSALNRARRGPAAGYESMDYLLVAVLNTLRSMSWQLGGDKKVPKPDPIEVPGMASSKAGTKQLGDAMSIEEMDRRLQKYKPR